MTTTMIAKTAGHGVSSAQCAVPQKPIDAIDDDEHHESVKENVRQ